ncbi:methyl-accepting chemotaxis protein [Alicyclobacillus tolerans]|uniref:Methyl-accepting chemotaxis protein (MCP) signalling domain-containing protein n=1 Tax=Alicyclobacillus tolerans TaxID=90970 RepID=A0A1M6XSY4_9BACL|nr:methyl-accepting chemotaxis protein [Alicyclobacillus montanus]SHL08969.1 Methyl-accepting chemotaxis protein (MCP) signalling domain-containing protein [Alicyclobacillus montanus]
MGLINIGSRPSYVALDAAFAVLGAQSAFYAALFDVESEKVVRVWKNHFDMKLREGDPLPEGSSLARKALESWTIQTGYYPAEQSVVGVTYRGAAIPVFDEEDDLMKYILGLYQPYRMDEVNKYSTILQNGLADVAMAGEGFAQNAAASAERAERMAKEVILLAEHKDRLTNLIRFLRESADELELLGLNSAIEAARLGTAGNPFRVIAERMRNFAQTAKKESRQTEEDLRHMAEEITNLQSMAEVMAAEAEEKAATSEELAAAVRGMSDTAQALQRLMEQVL